jgi:hypothetical protein
VSNSSRGSQKIRYPFHITFLQKGKGDFTGQSHVNLGTQRAVMRSLLGSMSIVLKIPVIRVGGPRHHPFG